tara:strand:+ start:4345 stop:4728 length:384 start_codon:yes stop_codon:yes gene_type:complete
MESALLQPGELEKALEHFIGQYGWMFIAGVALMIFQSSIKKFAAGIFVFCGNDYKTDDVVYVDGKPGRIIRVGITKTVFFIYDVHDGKVIGGSKLVVQNEWLGKLKIEKPLCQLDLTRFNGSGKTKP